MTTLRRAWYSSQPVHSRSPNPLGTEALMHRSRMPLLVIAAVVAACSKRDNSDTTKILSQDSTLAARVENSQNTDQQTASLPLPDACGPVEKRDQPTRKDK